MKNTTLIKKLEKLVRENKEIENYSCYVAYDSPDFVLQYITGINYNTDFHCINFEYPQYLGQQTIKTKELLKLLRQYNKKDVEIIDIEYSNYELKEIEVKNRKYSIDLYLVFKNRFEI